MADFPIAYIRPGVLYNSLLPAFCSTNLYSVTPFYDLLISILVLGEITPRLGNGKKYFLGVKSL